MVLLLTDGDITKEDYVFWNVTVSKAMQYVRYQSRKVLFREAVIKMIVGETDEEKSMHAQMEYEKAARIAERFKDGK